MWNAAMYPLAIRPNDPNAWNSAIPDSSATPGLHCVGRTEDRRRQAVGRTGSRLPLKADFGGFRRREDRLGCFLNHLCRLEFHTLTR